MGNTFNHGYVLLIGVGETAYQKWSLPVTVKDVQAIQSILKDPTLCGYSNDKNHIRLLCDVDAKRQMILDGLSWLKTRATTDPEATIVVYYSGHGWLDKSTGKYYLIPHDVEPFDIPHSALSAEKFTETLRAVSSKRLLVFIDSCHAEGMATSKDSTVLKLPSSLEQKALPKDLINELKQGEGRVVFTSSRGNQRSWIRPDNTMSIYTYHLIEALQGAGNKTGDTSVRVSNIMNYLGKAVPESASKFWQQDQMPFFDATAEDFPIALLRGGKGLPHGGWSAVKQEAAEVIRQITITGDGNVIGDGNASQVFKAEHGGTISGVTITGHE